MWEILVAISVLGIKRPRYAAWLELEAAASDGSSLLRRSFQYLFLALKTSAWLI